MRVVQRGSVTIDDVARSLGVAKGTVSRALNGYPDIAPGTRARVEAAAASLGYHASTNARRLKSGRTDTVGVVLPGEHGSLTEPFLASFLDGASRRLDAAGFDLLVVAAPGDADPIEPYRRLVQARKVDGFLLMRTAVRDSRIRFLREEGIPFVSHGRSVDATAFAWLDMDNGLAMRTAVSHLARLGHRRIAHVAGPSLFNFAQDRRQGYKAGLAEQDLTYDPALLVEGGLDAAHGLDATAQLLALRVPPTAIVAVTDAVAIGVLQGLRRHGLVPGQDVAVTGYDDVPLAAYTDPPLTTFTQDSTAAGATAASMLLQRLRGASVSALQTLWRARVVERQSTCPLTTTPAYLRRQIDARAGTPTLREV